MLKKRIIISLTFVDGILHRTKNFKPDYRYTKNFIDLWSIDELVIIDISGKKFKKEFLKVVEFFSTNCFVPLTVGGGISSLSDADIYFKYGADKILLGPNSIFTPQIAKEISMKYGKQSIIQSLDCKLDKYNIKKYNVFGYSGIKNLNQNPISLGNQALKNGIGEILINSIDNDGSLLGYDINLIKEVSKNLNCPIIALGGAGNWSHIAELFHKTDVSGACTQNIFHFTEQSIKSAKNFLKINGIKIRK
tara:strand:+ start:805 stop:1551 length:747 start_codon:yes stop_codon:yes gene_type:complete